MIDDDRHRWDPRRYAAHARFVADLGQPAVELLAPAAGERILDLGCGDGALTAKLVAAGCTVVGVDASAEMVAAARAAGIDARLMNAEALGFDAEFDAVFSNAALHWMARLDRVLAGVWRALRPGGRFVGECGGRGNLDGLLAGMQPVLARRGIDSRERNPWHCPGAAELQALLVTTGFAVESIARIERPTRLPGELRDWLRTFACAFVFDLDEAARETVFAQIAEAVRPDLCAGAGCWTLDYVRLRFRAERRGYP
ncbi:MAG: class I SAM-dependent methyltransferase [Gammaproteobacteria bacterium]|nr:class I SAM-dependent methyltransferase [Gammaproteobacteria bacterium]